MNGGKINVKHGFIENIMDEQILSTVGKLTILHQKLEEGQTTYQT